VDQPPDSRSPLAAAMEMASRVTAIAAQMVVPPVLGHWLDGRLGTDVLFAAVGAIFGLASGIWSLIQITKTKPSKRKP
jgi:hypothetical protein